MPNININRRVVLQPRTGVSLVLATIYTQNFNDGIASGFTTIGGNGWVLNNDGDPIPFSSGYTGASGGFAYAAANQSIISESLTFGYVSTVGYTNIGVQWGGYIEPGFPAASMVFKWSSDGVIWNTVSFTNVSSNATWALVPLISLPSGAAGITRLYLQWTYIADNQLIYAAIDDVKITGYH